MFKSIRHYWLRILGLPKTLYFNIRYLGLRKGMLMPIRLTHNVKLKKCMGSIEIKAPLKKNMIIWGYTGVSISPS